MTLAAARPAQQPLERAREETVRQVVAFHGHLCPGLAIGIRVAEAAMRALGPRAEDEELVAVVETGMCAVDAIQFLTGCTLGKGNLIHVDHGKNAFRFWRRDRDGAIRIVVLPGAMARDPEYDRLRRRAREGTATPEERERLGQLRQQRSWEILSTPEEHLLRVDPCADPAPAPARVHESLVCAACGESVMETRIRRFDGRLLCIPCFERADRRWGT